MNYTVVVYDENNAVVLTEHCDVDGTNVTVGSNAARVPVPAGMSVAEWHARLALFVAGPEICPWDCERCNE